ncbi:unnamed protein product [Larinioides sclopetarius]|uniref:Uncharacterized protein n=1 Tax=Larinioides sclopetarius TaxID=280406 RepID=A0AAV2AHK5_9ARAC
MALKQAMMRFYLLLALVVCVAVFVVQAEGMEFGFLRGARKIRQSGGGDTANIKLCLLDAGISTAQLAEILPLITGLLNQ